MTRPPIAQNARSRRTRERLLATARTLLEEEGFDSLTMTAVAERSGVTRRSVYLHFASRSELVAALFDHVAASEGLHDSLERVWAARTAGDALAEWARHLSQYHVRLLPVDRAISRVQHADADAAAHRRRVSTEKLASCRALATRLRDEGQLAQPWTVESAADMLMSLSTSDVIEGLILDSGWSSTRFVKYFGLLLRSTFLPSGSDGTTR